MGGGRNYQQAGTSAPTWGSTLEAEMPSAGNTEAGGSSGDASEFCTRNHRLRFRVAEHVNPAVGDAVELVPNGQSLLVIGGAGSVGHVVGPAASALEACVRKGFRLRGAVESVNGVFAFARIEGEAPG